MKNRLYHGLFIVYLAMVAFVMYINGVFSGNVTSVSNLVINGVFLGIIGILFAISIASFIRLNFFTGELKYAADELQAGYQKAGNRNVWASVKETKDFFEEKNLSKAFEEYCAQVRISRSSIGQAPSCDIEDYINEELLEKVGSNYFNSGISGAMTGLGILGTFIGLSLGLGAFNGDDIYTISDNVGPLLSGMKVAFHTSVYGIIFSLIFNIVYRSIMADAYEKLNYFLSTFRRCAMPPTVRGGDDNATAMLVYQANLADYMKQLLELAKGESDLQAESLERMSHAFVEKLQSVMDTEFTELGLTLKFAAKSQIAIAEGNRALLEAANALVESSRKMQEAMEYLMGRQEALEEELRGQKEELETTWEDISRNVSIQLHAFEQMRSVYENKN